MPFLTKTNLQKRRNNQNADRYYQAYMDTWVVAPQVVTTTARDHLQNINMRQHMTIAKQYAALAQHWGRQVWIKFHCHAVLALRAIRDDKWRQTLRVRGRQLVDSVQQSAMVQAIKDKAWRQALRQQALGVRTVLVHVYYPIVRQWVQQGCHVARDFVDSAQNFIAQYVLTQLMDKVVLKEEAMETPEWLRADQL